MLQAAIVPSSPPPLSPFLENSDLGTPGFCSLEISGEEGLFQGITYEIRNISKIITSE